MALLSGSLEMQVLVGCVPNLQGGGTAFIDVAAGLDWNKLIMLAGYHGFLPLLSLKMTQQDWEGVPAEFHTLLDTFQINNMQRSLIWSAALEEVQGHCRLQGLPVLSWKGPLLAIDLYGAITLREYASLGLLVRREDVPTLIELVSYLGYRHQAKTNQQDAAQRVGRGIDNLCFFRPDDGVYLELHTQLMPSSFSQWQDAEKYFQEVPWRPRLHSWTFKLPPDKLLLSLCAHGLRHSWERLKWLADVALLVEKYRDVIDWKALVVSSAYQQKLDVLLYSLCLASDVFAVVLPMAIVDAAHGRSVLLEWAQENARSLMSGEMRSEEAERTRQLAIFFPSRISRLLFMLRHMMDQQDEGAVHSQTAISGFRQVVQQHGMKGLIEKTGLAIRITFS